MSIKKKKSNKKAEKVIINPERQRVIEKYGLSPEEIAKDVLRNIFGGNLETFESPCDSNVYGKMMSFDGINLWQMDLDYQWVVDRTISYPSTRDDPGGTDVSEISNHERFEEAIDVWVREIVALKLDNVLSSLSDTMMANDFHGEN